METDQSTILLPLLVWVSATVLCLAGWAWSIFKTRNLQRQLNQLYQQEDAPTGIEVPVTLLVIGALIGGGTIFWSLASVPAYSAQLREGLMPGVNDLAAENKELQRQLEVQAEVLTQTQEEIATQRAALAAKTVELAAVKAATNATNQAAEATEPPPPAPVTPVVKETPIETNLVSTPTPDASDKTADPAIEQINSVLIAAILQGTTVDMATVTSATLISQLDKDPLSFSSLQYAIKERLKAGYTRTYLGSLKTVRSETHIWKIKTVSRGPDILERLVIEFGKVSSFWFDGLK